MYPLHVQTWGRRRRPTDNFVRVKLETQRPIKVAIYDPMHQRVCV